MQQFIAIGHLVTDPDISETKSGKHVCRFRIGVPRRQKDEEGHFITDFFGCVAWEKLADMIAQWTRKGSKVFISGDIRVSDYVDNDGIRRFKWEVNVFEIQMLDRGQRNDANFVD